jgi:hypothetical protein
VIEVYQLPIDRKKPNRSPCAASTRPSAREFVQAAFDSLLASDAGLRTLVAAMQKKELKAVVFGGWARDRLAEHLLGRTHTSRDIDLVSHGVHPVADVFPAGSSRNPFGGVGFDSSCIHVDAWNLSETFLLQRHALPVKFSELPATADYNVNAIIFQPAQFFHQTGLLDRGAGQALSEREIDFMADEVAQPCVQAARSVILSTRLELRLSDTVRRFVRDKCRTRAAVEAVQDGIAVYCPAERRSQALALLQELIGE